MPRPPLASRSLTPLLWLAALFLCTLAISQALNFDRLQNSLIARFGQEANPLFLDWKRTLAEARALPEAQKIARINDFFNKRIRFDDDGTIWGQADYWATPMETLGQGKADCEDYSIAKYYSLLSIGVPMQKLRLVYVRAMLDGRLQAHMVLAYFATPGADPLILDNLIGDIRPASSRADLSPIFSFNSAGLWQGTGSQSSNSNLSRWQDLIQRARNEGFTGTP